VSKGKNQGKGRIKNGKWQNIPGELKPYEEKRFFVGDFIRLVFGPAFIENIINFMGLILPRGKINPLP